MNATSKINYLLKKVEKLEQENAMLRRDFSSITKGDTVSVPAAMKPLFALAQKNVGDYFQELNMDPTHGTIEISDQRYILIRASALSIDFINTIQKLYSDKGEKEALNIGKNLLFDIAHIIGMNDAKNFHSKMHLTDPISKLSAGPVHFAYTGWAYVDILPESNPTLDENYFLIFNHPYSFEAESWISSGKRSEFPVCTMNSGYSSGWCEESFGFPLTTVEVTCKAKGDDKCTFIMSPPHKIQEHVEHYTSIIEKAPVKNFTYDIPSFFERKKVEEMMSQKTNELESSNKELEQFAYITSHDLQEPLRTIANFVGLLMKDYNGKLDTQADQYMTIILKATSKMQNLIKDLLVFSRIGKGMTFEFLDCNDMLKEVINEMKQEISISNSKISFSKLPKVYGAEIELKRLFQILLDNAIKFRKENTSPQIEIGAEEKGGEFLFTVKDNGIGIDEQYKDKLFVMFQRLHNGSEYEGTGIGLAASKKIITLHNGKIWFESKLGEGSVFYFTIPTKLEKIK